MKRAFAAVVLLGGLSIACGQSAPPGAPGQPATAVPAPGMPGAPPAPAMPYAVPAPVAVAPGAPATATPVPPGLPGVPQNPFAALGQMAQAMQGVQAPNAGAVTNWRQLGEALPTAIPSWTTEGEVQGSTGGAMGFAVSEASRELRQGERTLRYKIIDSSLNQMAAMMFQAARTVQVDSSEEVQRPAELAGNPGFLKYQNRGQRGEATFMVANRYLVEINTTGSPNADEILQLAAYVNVARLGQLAAVPPPAPQAAPAPAPVPAP